MIHIEIVDTHIHSIFRSNDDFINLVKKGVTKAISVAFYPIVPLYSNTLIDLFNWIIDDEPSRTKSTGIRIFPSIGVHPRSIPQDLTKENLKKIKAFLCNVIEEKKIVALGEIGLESAIPKEKDIFEFHLQIAKEFDFPIIVHTPRRNKKEITKKSIELILKNKIEKGVLDHIDEQNLSIAKKTGLNLGLTVQIGKLTPENFYKIVNENENETDRFVLNTDIGRDEADLFAAHKAINILKNKGISEDVIDLIASRNAKKLFKI